MNKINKVRKGEVRIYKGMTYVAVPEIKEDHCTGCSSSCYSISDNRSPEEKHEEEMRFCREFNDLRCEMLIDMAKKIEAYLSHN